MTKAGSILILIMFIISSFVIIPLLWTIPGFILYSKINKEEATEGQILAFAILGIVGGILILVDSQENNNSKTTNNKEHVINQHDVETK